MTVGCPSGSYQPPPGQAAEASPWLTDSQSTQLRRDRILDEARHTADPVHLMTVFGVTTRTAMTYVQAAHPERRPTLPR